MRRSKGRSRLGSGSKRKHKTSGDMFDRVLIVTEGRVTEKEYFECLKAKLGLGSHQVVVLGSEGESTPVQVVENAQRRLENRGEDFKYVYCVFDMDGDDRRFRDGIAAVQKMEKDNGDIEKVEAITSVPCFEFWLWLHVSDRIRPYPTTGNPCQILKKDIKKFDLFKNYSTKAGLMKSIFESLDENRGDALNQSNSIFDNAEDEEQIYWRNPSTRVCVVVEHLKGMSSERKKEKRRKIRNAR